MVREPDQPVHGIKRMFDVRTPMRDGVELSTDVWLPDGEHRHPLILFRTPYLKSSLPSPATMQCWGVPSRRLTSITATYGLVGGRERALASALLLLILNLIGLGFGPLLAGMLSDGLRGAFVERGVAEGAALAEGCAGLCALWCW
jgi:hypothetical protein